ncbi:hypothetical protein HQN87_00760 [Paenibacillus tritici]|jgi:hypothetical protein|uniref:Uncharacterized protein n=1 Tax=Paenibacillus tritici TaxID=1873425 RepID=A0ABX2DGW6_9BACL|nr:hypothetical protein [Paenibacillus tritici]NQX43845.1 hypothetical protein [Paenibacillus tritici]
MKKNTRKLLLRKYAVILLLSALSVLYLYLTDWMLGYGLGNISYILNYLLYTASEKLTAAALLLLLIIPDAIYWIRGNQPGRGAEK